MLIRLEAEGVARESKGEGYRLLVLSNADDEDVIEEVE